MLLLLRTFTEEIIIYIGNSYLPRPSDVTAALLCVDDRPHTKLNPKPKTKLLGKLLFR